MSISGRLAGLVFAAVAAGPALAGQWAKTFGDADSEIGGVIPLNSGGFTLYGTTTTSNSGIDSLYGELDADGSPVWLKQIGGSKADYLSVQRQGSGFLVTGTTRSFPAPGVSRDNLLWAKFDAQWSPIYARVFGKAGTAESGSFSKTKDGGMLFAGSVATYLTNTTFDGDILLLKIRPNGTIEWKSTLDYGFNDVATQAVEVDDGFVVSGMLQDPVVNTWAFLVMKLDKTGGGVLWKKMYSIDIATSFDRIGSGGGIRKLADGSFLIMGVLQQLNPLLVGNRTILARINANGGLLWANSYGAPKLGVQASSVSEITAEDALLVSGSMTVSDATSPNFGNASVLAMKVATDSGAVGLQKRIGGAGQYNSGSLQRSGTLLFLSGMHAASLTDLGTHLSVLYAKLNPTTLKPVWAKTFGGAYREMGIVQKAAAGYVIGGTSYSFGQSTNSKGDIFGLTLDGTGSYPGCTWVADITLANTTPGVTATPLALQVTTPTLATGASLGTPSSIALTVTDATLPGADICSPI
jgi:hypothetical protein